MPDRKSGINEFRDALDHLKEERERYLEEKELEKEGKKLPRDYGEHAIRERVSGDSVERTSENANNKFSYIADSKTPTIFGKKYIKGDKNSKIRLILFIALIVAIIVFFVLINILPRML